MKSRGGCSIALGRVFDVGIWLSQELDSVLRDLGTDVGVETHDFRIDVTNPGSDDGLLDALGQAPRNKRVAKRVRFSCDSELGQHSFQRGMSG